MTYVTAEFDRAVTFARVAHAAQARKGTVSPKTPEIPYIAHLLGVCSLVLEDGGSQTEAIAALLHDAVEDGGGERMRAQIAAEFGEEVAAIVQACSDTPDGWTGGAKGDWRQRKEGYIAHVKSHCTPGAVRVSLADKLHNARSIVFDVQTHGPEVWKRFNPKSDQPWYHGKLVEAFRKRNAGPMVDELERVVAEMRLLPRKASDA
jgi:(p)ppGpp synthase/HD superfamily hydrolase